IMEQEKQNIISATERQDKLNVLTEEADSLRVNAVAFESEGSKLKKNMRNKWIQRIIILVVVIIAVILIIIGIVFGKKNSGSSGSS
ncbi:MAG: hypothetical protein MHPSP_003876, partial [Paramarteilia canceri]